LLDNAASDGALLLGFGEFEHCISELMSTLSAQYSVTPLDASKFKTNNRSTNNTECPYSTRTHTKGCPLDTALDKGTSLGCVERMCQRPLYGATHTHTHTPSTAAPKNLTAELKRGFAARSWIDINYRQFLLLNGSANPFSAPSHSKKW
jgi:hypothetical protein